MVTNQILRYLDYLKGFLRNFTSGKCRTFYPSFINFSVTNKCNFNCIMCGLKSNVEKTTMTPDEIFSIFSQDLFKKVRHVGISGGEPFLRDDLVQVIENIIRALPSGRGISIISNGSLPEKIAQTLPEIQRKCDYYGVKLSFMLSLDGVGAIHDKNRGIKGAFEKTSKSIEIIKKLNVKNFSLSCTITKTNIDDLNRVLSFAKSIEIPIKFRVATKIDRLFNEDKMDNFSFSRFDKIKIVKFLDKLIQQYENNLFQRIRYISIKDMLLNNHYRISGCYWQKEGASIDPSGNLFYCFVKSKELGNLLENNGKEIFFSNENVEHKKRIILDYCNGCIHDYNGYPPLKIVIKQYFKFLDKYIRIMSYGVFLIAFSILYPFLKKLRSKNGGKMENVYITGWYGTETIGDKAILGGIYNSIRKLNPKAHIFLSSSVPYYSEETVFQMKFNNIKIIDKSIKKSYRYIKKSDYVIIGGGPLMDIGPTIGLLWEFFIANLLKKQTIILGCGLGPLNKKIFQITVKYLMNITSLVILRDENSAIKYPKLVKGIHKFDLIDPSVGYIKEYSFQGEKNSNGDNYVLFCIRDWPKNYSTFSIDEYKSKREDFNKTIIKICNYLLEMGFAVRFYPMNTYYVGDDDRDFYDIIKESVRNTENLFFYESEYNLDETLKIFKNSRFIIAMRFHSAVFGNGLGIPTISIDYDTNQGKVFGFVNKFGLQDLYVNISNIDYFNLKILIDNVILNNGKYKEDLKKKEIILEEYLDKMDNILNSYINGNLYK